MILIKLVETTKAKLTFYTKTDMSNIENLINPAPDAYFIITVQNKSKKRYFLDVFDPYKPWKTYKWRVQNYITYFKSQEWQVNMKKPFPEVILICPSIDIQNWLAKTIKKLRDGDNPEFYLSIWEKVKKQGMNKQTLQKVE